MSIPEALEALDECGAVAEKLAKICCEPNRSPRMAELASTLDRARSHLVEIQDSGAANEAIAAMSDAGSQLGALQVECCAPPRMPLYETMLRQLSLAQRAVTAEFGLGH